MTTTTQSQTQTHRRTRTSTSSTQQLDNEPVSEPHPSPHPSYSLKRAEVVLTSRGTLNANIDLPPSPTPNGPNPTSPSTPSPSPPTTHNSTPPSTSTKRKRMSFGGFSSSSSSSSSLSGNGLGEPPKLNRIKSLGKGISRNVRDAAQTLSTGAGTLRRSISVNSRGQSKANDSLDGMQLGVKGRHGRAYSESVPRSASGGRGESGGGEWSSRVGGDVGVPRRQDQNAYSPPGRVSVMNTRERERERERNMSTASAATIRPSRSLPTTAGPGQPLTVTASANPNTLHHSVPPLLHSPHSSSSSSYLSAATQGVAQKASMADFVVPQILQQGTPMTKVSAKKQRRVVFRLDPDQGQIIWEGKKHRISTSSPSPPPSSKVSRFVYTPLAEMSGCLDVVV